MLDLVLWDPPSCGTRALLLFCTFGDFFLYSGSRGMSPPHSTVGVIVPFVPCTVTLAPPEVRDPSQTFPRWDREFPTHVPSDFLLEKEMNGWVLPKAELPQQHLAGCKFSSWFIVPSVLDRQNMLAVCPGWHCKPCLAHGALHKRGTSCL